VVVMVWELRAMVGVTVGVALTVFFSFLGLWLELRLKLGLWLELGGRARAW